MICFAVRTAKGGLKIHTCWDALQIPDLVNITDAKTHVRYGLRQTIFVKNTIIVEYRAYFDFDLMLNRMYAENIFVTRKKSNTQYQSIEELELPNDTNQDILKVEIIVLTGVKAIETNTNEHKLT